MRKLMIVTVTAFFLVVAANGAALGAMIEYLSIPGIAFLPLDENYVFDREGSDLVPANAESNIWFAPLYLPDGVRLSVTGLGAIICGFRTPATEVDIKLWERDFVTSAQTQLVLLEIDGYDGNCTLFQNPLQIETLKIVDNEKKTYFITVEGLTGGEFTLSGNLRLRAVRVGYYVKARFQQ